MPDDNYVGLRPVAPKLSVGSEFTPDTLEQLSGICAAVKATALFEVEEAGADCFALEHFMIGLALLEQAQRAFSLAGMYQARELARLQRS